MKRRIAAFIFILAASLNVRGAYATVLNIQPVAQQTPEWCFAASSAMVFEHLGYPNLNPAGDFQCGVVAAQGSPCMANCAACLNSGGTMQRVAFIMNSYATLALQLTGYRNANVHLQEFGILSPQQIANQIDRDGPILAGISPGQVPYPPGFGVSQHAVVIVGYEGNVADFSVVINDPYPYPLMADPYVAAGSIKLQPGQYQIAFPIFVNIFHYGNSLTFR